MGAIIQHNTYLKSEESDPTVVGFGSAMIVVPLGICVGGGEQLIVVRWRTMGRKGSERENER